MVEISQAICWPDKLPVGSQISFVSRTINVAGLPILSHAVRLTGRFTGSNPCQDADFKSTVSQKLARALGFGSHAEDDDQALDSFERTKLLQEGAEEGPGTGHLEFRREALELTERSYEEGRFRTVRSMEGDDAAEHLRHALHMEKR